MMDVNDFKADSTANLIQSDGGEEAKKTVPILKAIWSKDVMADLEQTDPSKEEDHWRKQSIFKLPTFVKERNVKAYEPQVISIGPYHHGKHHLKPMEVHKYRALRHFVKRFGEPLQSYESELKKVVHPLKESYAQLDKVWEDEDKFVQLMILDGCFILEFLMRWDDYAYSDPVFSYHGHIVNYNSVMQDLLLVENQLPYLVLFTLASISTDKEVVHRNLCHMMFAPEGGPRLHMLDFYMKGLLEGGEPFEEEIVVKHCASELHQSAGIQFKKVGGFKNIKFDKKTAVLKLPSIIINDYTISTFLNLIAFELRVGTGRELNTYIRLMDNLVDSAKDVKLLQKQGIIVSSLESDEAVVKVLKELTKDTVVDLNCMSNVVMEEMENYYGQSKKKWSRKIRDSLSKLYHDYFSNPWSTISVAAAAFLLALTVIQTLFTVLSFYSGKNNKAAASSGTSPRT